MILFYFTNLDTLRKICQHFEQSTEPTLGSKDFPTKENLSNGSMTRISIKAFQDDVGSQNLI